ncbi:MAG: chorismate synthase [Clostridia bacterium]|nr:chorismate synthase [Clostridia bacterium]
MSSFYGENIKMAVFGQSHAPGIGVTIDGIPAGKKIDFDRLSAFLRRRAPGRDPYSTPRNESDVPEFICGFSEGGVTCGAPVTAIIRNKDTRSSDYAAIADVPRPGHADYTALVKYGPSRDAAGGGHFSGRLTAPVCVAGGIVLQLLEDMGVTVKARIVSLGKVRDDGAEAACDKGAAREDRGPAVDFPASSPAVDFPASSPAIDFPVSNLAVENAMKQAIEEAKAAGDSLGGVLECVVEGVPAGVGDPMFGGLENRISGIVFGIPAVKGIEFGSGFACASMPGSENNDGFCFDENGKVVTETNNCGGILGGISNGMPIVFRVAIKPTPSIAKPQKSVDLKTGEQVILKVPGRHDPCIVPRAVPVIEAAAAIAVYDAILGR